MRRVFNVLVFIVIALVGIGLSAQPPDSRIDIRNVAIENGGRTLALEIVNLHSEPITGYRVTAVPDCPEGVNTGASSVQRLFSTVDPAKVGEWYLGSPSDTGAIAPGSARKVTVDVDKPVTASGPCKDAKLGAVTAVFADGAVVGDSAVAQEILNYRRGESKQYSRWLKPLEDALASADPSNALAALLQKLDAEYAASEIRDGDDFGEGERQANRSIRRTLLQLTRVVGERQDLAGELAQRLLKLHQVRTEGLARY